MRAEGREERMRTVQTVPGEGELVARLVVPRGRECAPAVRL